MKRKIRVGLLVLLLLVTGIIVYISQMPKKVMGYSISTGEYENVISAIGYVEYDVETMLQAEVSGKLTTLYVSEGDTIKEEGLIARLDDTKARQRYQDLEGSLRLAQSRYDDYLNNFQVASETVRKQRQTKTIEIEGYTMTKNQLDEDIQKMQQLYSQGAISMAEFEAIENERDKVENNIEAARAALEALSTPAFVSQELKASVDVAQEQLDQQALELEKYALESPFDAIVLDMFLNPGEMVQAGQDIMRIGSADKKVVWVDIDEKYIGSLDIGQDAFLTAEAYPDRSYKGRIRGFAPQVNKDTGTIGVEVEVVEGNDALIANMSVKVEVTTASLRDVILIPGDYIYEENPLSVLVVNGQGEVETRSIRVQNQNRNMLYVMEGLAAQEILLMPEDIEPGDKVEVQEVNSHGI